MRPHVRCDSVDRESISFPHMRLHPASSIQHPASSIHGIFTMIMLAISISISISTYAIMVKRQRERESFTSQCINLSAAAASIHRSSGVCNTPFPLNLSGDPRRWISNNRFSDARAFSLACPDGSLTSRLSLMGYNVSHRQPVRKPMNALSHQAKPNHGLLPSSLQVSHIFCYTSSFTSLASFIRPTHPSIHPSIRTNHKFQSSFLQPNSSERLDFGIHEGEGKKRARCSMDGRSNKIPVDGSSPGV